MSKRCSLLFTETDYGIFTLGLTIVAWIDRDRLIADMSVVPHAARRIGVAPADCGMRSRRMAPR